LLPEKAKIPEMCSGFEICYPKYISGVQFFGYSDLGSGFRFGFYGQAEAERPKISKKLNLSLH
jgi:hypothetical protein